MRTRTIVAALASAALAACASGSAAGPARTVGTAATKPTLQLLERIPLTVVGRGFAASERLTLTADVNGNLMRVVARTDRRGRLEVAFRKLAVGRCQNYRVVARGGRTVRAILVSPPAECAQE